MSFGLYFHIPFCQARCNYCHFISVPYNSEIAGRYVSALLGEIGRYAAEKAHPDTVDSIYFGGGTPSIVEERYIAAILTEDRQRFEIRDDCEISLEANPGTITPGKLKVYREEGINRISLGAQSFMDRELSIIGRLHDASVVVKTVKQLQHSGFDNISLDLMLGLPYQTRVSWRRSLEAAMSLGIHHVSIYMLDLDDQCPLYAMVSNGSASLPDDDLLSDLYLETIEFLSAHGYAQYEISNFALPGYACRHNLKYWHRKPYRGFGVGSHSFSGESRYANKSSIDGYLAAVESGSSALDWQEPINRIQSLQETLFLGMRLTEGLNWRHLQEAYGAELLKSYLDPLHDLRDRGLVCWVGDTIRLTAAGMLVSNEIFQLFV